MAAKSKAKKASKAVVTKPAAKPAAKPDKKKAAPPKPEEKKKAAKKTAAVETKPAEKKKAAKAPKAEAKPKVAKGKGQTSLPLTGSAVEAEILGVVKCDARGKDEEFNAYASRVAEAIDETEGAWEKLSKPAQKWFAEAAEASNADKPMPQFPIAAAAEDEPKASKKKAAAAEEKPAKKAGNGKAAPKKERKKRVNLTAQVMAIACADLDLDADGVVKEAKKAKIELAESQMRGAFRLAHLVVGVMREVGALKR